MEQQAANRAKVTKRRYGEDFYAQIGRKSMELRKRAQAGDAEVMTVLDRRRSARTRRRAVWLEVLEAREAVVLLRDELQSRARANLEPSCAVYGAFFRYTDDLRSELAQAEQRLAQIQAEHRALLRDLRLTVAILDD